MAASRLIACKQGTEPAQGVRRATGSSGGTSGSGSAPWRGWWRSGCARTGSASRAADGRPGACSRATSRGVARRRRRARRRCGRHRPGSPRPPRRRAVPRSSRSRVPLKAEALGLEEVFATGPEGRAAVEVGRPLASPGVGGAWAARAARPRRGRSGPASGTSLAMATPRCIDDPGTNHFGHGHLVMDCVSRSRLAPRPAANRRECGRSPPRPYKRTACR